MKDERNKDEQKDKVRVAIVGSGLAGLTIAHILQADKHKRYAVTILEQSPRLSFDSVSVSVKASSGAEERIDLPMRAAAGGYYHNLMRMYAHLEIPMHPVRFLFVFAKALPSLPSLLRPHQSPGSIPGCYFVHASNLHQMPPPWPQSRGLILHLVEIFFLIVCQAWFTLACFLVPPASSASSSAVEESNDDEDGADETLRDYLDRIWLPRRYISHYLLPLMSSVSTCSHSEMLDFPASDIIHYKRLSHGQQHYVVCGGIRQVQSRLVEGIADIRLAVRVQSVRPAAEPATGICVRWKKLTQGYAQEGQRATHAYAEETFDRVILAVSPDVAASIFAPLRPLLACVPTQKVESSVLDAANAQVVQDESAGACSHHGVEGNKAQVITFRTAFSSSAGGSRTEALHAMPSGVIVQTRPLGDADENLGLHSPGKGTLQTARFTRTLRSRQSRRVVNEMMREDDRGGKDWVNGRDNVWLAGAWCWDGMVLLEGCVVSAMRIARDFGVEVPWD